VENIFQRVDDETSESWDNIKVPGVWELQGYGTPYYLAKSYPPQIDIHKNKIPSISSTDNPTGAYVKSFILPESFNKQRIFIRLGAVKSAFVLWINGIEIGFSKASMTSHEFEITQYVKEGSNKVAVLVYKYSDGTYLEDQDMWFFGGITRDVTIFAEPQTYLFDTFASCELIYDYTDAYFKLDVTLDGELYSDLNLKVVLTYTTDQVIFHGKLDALQTHIETLIEKPALWTAETPHLVVIKIYLFQGQKLIQAKKFKFGFRSIEIKNSQFLINGRPIKFKGVNRHDFDPENAWGISKETRLKDLLIMKSHNINAIRTSHYPNHPHLYELANELGLYVIDEADLETHGIRKFLPDDQLIWTNAGIDRNTRMVLRDRNHPCIVMWSLGNEAGEGSGFIAMRKAVKALDSTRPIHYEGDKQAGLSDVYSMMYPSTHLEIKYGEKQDIKPQSLLEKATRLFLSRKPIKKEDYQNLPILNCEYAHCMENSLGNFKDHVDNFEKYDNLIGGFIWDFVDQSIKHTQADGSVQWLYGGDFKEGKTDAFFCANGLIASDRSLHPAISEVKQVYANLSITDYQIEDHSVLIKNKNVFIDTSYALFVAKILCEGNIISQELIHVPPIHPRNQLRVPLKPIQFPDSQQEIILEISALEKEDRPWAIQGHEICFGQFVLRPFNFNQTINTIHATLRFHQSKENFLIQTNAYTAILNSSNGLLESLDYGQGNVLKSPLDYNFTRADLDNDCGIEIFVPLMRHFNPIRYWEKAQSKLKLHRIEIIESESDFISFRIRHKMPGLRKFETKLSFSGDGLITVTVDLKPKKDMIRFGMSLGLDHSYQNIDIYGRGPQENYVDRKTGSKIGLVQGNFKDFAHDYMRPQENGNHTDVRFLQIYNTNGILRFESITERLMETSVWPYTQAELKKATHIHELPLHKITTVNLDYGQKGVAGDLPGYYQSYDQYQLKANVRYRYGFSIIHHFNK
ncbi:MAG: protein BgaM, partial [Erysipelotrichaceae bacterium]